MRILWLQRTDIFSVFQNEVLINFVFGKGFLNNCDKCYMGFFRGITICFIIVTDYVSNVLTNVYKIIKFKIDFTIINFITSIILQENIVSDIDIYNYYTKGAVSYKIKVCQS
jgi:hypothetical protein